VQGRSTVIVRSRRRRRGRRMDLGKRVEMKSREGDAGGGRQDEEREMSLRHSLLCEAHKLTAPPSLR